MSLTINIDDSLNVTITKPCDACEVDVPINDHCGEDGQYLCPDCYGNQRAKAEWQKTVYKVTNQRFVHDWLIFCLCFDSDENYCNVAIHKSVMGRRAHEAEYSVPNPEDHISRFGPGTCAMSMQSIEDMHFDVNHVYTLVDEGYINGQNAHLIFKGEETHECHIKEINGINDDDIGEPWRKAKFSIDGVQEYEGYHWGKRWNGWACPMFTIEVMRQIADDLGEGEWCPFLRVEGDTVIHYPDGDEDQYRDTGTIRQRDGIPTMNLYSFDGWIWEEVEGGE